MGLWSLSYDIPTTTHPPNKPLVHRATLDIARSRLLTYRHACVTLHQAMHTINSSGRRVSLLNDDSSVSRHVVPGVFSRQEREDPQLRSLVRAGSYNSQGSSPRTPDLLRSDSYDSGMTLDPASPPTPSRMEFGRQTSFTSSYPDPTQYEQRPYSNYSQKMALPSPSSTSVQAPFAEQSSNSFDDDQNPSERTIPGKRYPCRFKDSHGCDKTFTTSGHASRHSKIHTAEKCVQCSFQGCHKKFTRADNMKQHLETHYKERSRVSSSAQKSSFLTTTSKLTVSAGIQKQGARISRPPSRAGRASIDISASYVQYASSSGSGHSPMASPVGSYGSLDLHNFRQVLPTGLDALVDAVEFHSRR